MKKIISFMVVFVLVLMCAIPTTNASQTSVLRQPLSSGVILNKYQVANSYFNNVNHMEINLNDPFTKLNLGLSKGYGIGETITSIANRHSFDQNRVVGAINASFFHLSSAIPMYLISMNNEVYNNGSFSNDSTQYVSQPIAFGITSNGLAEIDTYDIDLSLTHNGNIYEVNGVNRQRQSNESIIFTPQHYDPKTLVNEYGIQIVVETNQNIESTFFGQTLTGKVTAIYPYGQKVDLQIPKNGFVIAASNSKATELAGVKLNDEISVSISIDQKWQNSEFMVGSGPMLLKDGKPYLTIDPNSSRAKERTARSAIAISSDKKRVHFVTVDYVNGSKGMTLPEFANYLASLGFDRAINLDGGGSTAMAFRDYGSNNVILANHLKDNYQRRLPSIIEAISTAPVSDPKIVKFSRTNFGTLLAGTSSTVTVQYILDQYYNPLVIDSSKLALASEKGSLQINGMSFTSSADANDRIVIYYDGKALESFPVSIVKSPSTMTISGQSELFTNVTSKYQVEAKDSNGNQIIYDSNMLKWSVEGEIGTITSDGTFTSTKVGEGSIVATLGEKTVKFPVKVKPTFTDIPTTHPYYTQISFLSSKGYISGYEDNTFKPTNEITRAHAALIIAKVKGLDTTNVTNPNFTDVPPTHIYYKQIAAIQNAGIMSGKGDNTFDPNGKLTRGQMAVIIANAFNLTGDTTKPFSDVPADHPFYRFVQALASNKVTSGYEDGTFKPGEHINRAHFAIFLYEAIN